MSCDYLAKEIGSRIEGTTGVPSTSFSVGTAVHNTPDLDDVLTEKIVAMRQACRLMQGELEGGAFRNPMGWNSRTISALRGVVESGRLVAFDEAMGAYYQLLSETDDPDYREECETAVNNLAQLLDNYRPPMPDTFASEADAADFVMRHAAFGHECEPFGECRGDFYGLTLVLAEPRPIADLQKLLPYSTVALTGAEVWDDATWLPEPDNEEMTRVIRISADSTKGRRSSWEDRDGRDMYDYLMNGSPERKTNRSGPGTKGTRAAEGVKCDLWLLTD